MPGGKNMPGYRYRTVAVGLIILVLAWGVGVNSPSGREGIGPSSASAAALPLLVGTVVISQVYGGGGNVGAVYNQDFIELLNRGTVTVDLTGWTVQHASATGADWASTPMVGTIAPGQYYLV